MLKITDMKKIVISLLGLLLGLTMYAQFPMAAGGKGQAPPSIGHFYGKIVSDSVNRPVDGASVVLLQNRMDTVSKKRKDIFKKLPLVIWGYL